VALAETAKLVVDLSLKGNFARQVGTANRALGKLDTQLNNTESRAYRAGQQIGTGIKRAAALGAVGIGILAVNVKQGLDSLVALEEQTTQTNAVIKSTGGVAGVTAAQVRALAEEFESMNATIGDEVIQSAENLLLGFTNVNKKAFKPALLAILDINTRLGKGPGGLAGTAQLVGRALQDPVKGLGRLERVIGPLDAKTKKQIKSLVKQNRLYDAQALLLKEIEKRFGNAFKAEGGTVGAQVKGFYDAIEDLQRLLAQGLFPVVKNVAKALQDLLQDPEVQRGVEEFGQNLGKLLSPANIKSGIGAIKDVFTTIAAVAGPAATAVGAMVSAFSKLPPDLRNILIGAFAVNKLTGGLITNIAGAFKDMVVGSMNVQAANVTVVGGGAGAGGIPGAAPASKGIGALGKVFLIGEAIGLVAAVNEVRQSVQDSATQQAQAVHGDLLTLLNKPNTTDAQLLLALNGVNAGINALQADPLAVALVSGPALTELQNMKTLLENRLPQSQGGAAPDKSLMDHLRGEHGRPGGTTGGHDAAWQKLHKDQLEARHETSRGFNATKAAVNATKTAVVGTKTAVQVGDNHVASTVSSSVAASTGAIVGAIWAARPVVNVTNVTKSTTIQERYGNGNGSQGTDALHNAGGH
jgi:hypothetical protein